MSLVIGVSIHHPGEGRVRRLKASLCCTYSSVRGVIFFSGSSSSANSFLYFSQLCPVALGILGIEALYLFVGDVNEKVDPAAVGGWREEAIEVANLIPLRRGVSQYDGSGRGLMV